MTAIRLRGGHETNDPRLDRLPQFDERSRNYPIRTLVTATRPRSYTWRVSAWLDQGTEGACVGFAWNHEAAARPVVRQVTHAAARQTYLRAQQLDQWPGEAYSGTSVIAGAKAMQERGWLQEYRWAFSLDDLILAVGYKGPAVLGLDWYQGMFRPDSDGYLRPTGRLMGGHAILCHAVSVRERYFWLWNSWGRGWGVGGRAKISFDDLAGLLAAGGEACVPVRR